MSSSVHPYRLPEQAPEDYSVGIDAGTSYINRIGKPALATECCWGALEDRERTKMIEIELNELTNRGYGFLCHLPNHTLVADSHRREDGYVGAAGSMAFIEEDGSLRSGHDIFNRY